MNEEMNYLDEAIYQDSSLDREINLILQERLLRYRDNLSFRQSSAYSYSEELCNDNKTSLSTRLWKTISTSSSELVNHWLGGYGYLRLSELVSQFSSTTEVFKRVIEREGKNNRKRTRRGEFIAPYIWQNHKRRNAKKSPKINRLLHWNHDNKDVLQSKNLRISTEPKAVSSSNYSKPHQSLGYHNSYLFQQPNKGLAPKNTYKKLFCSHSALSNDETMLDIQFTSTDSPVEVRKVLQSLFG